MLALSTCWNSSRHMSGEDLLREIVDLGFRHVEVSHGINLAHMEGILKFAERGEVSFTSLHNFCPQPVEVLGDSPDCYEFSSSRVEIRKRAVKMTLQTIDYAVRLGAPRIVLHLGSVGALRGTTRDLLDQVGAGHFLSKAYAEQKLQAVIERERASDEHLHRVKECLKPIVEAAGEKGVRLGIENRDRYEQIPAEAELPDLLRLLAPVCGYWHDFGHAQRKENLAFLDHAEWLEKVGRHAIGAHLHDAVWPADDHRVPFTGEIDYARLVPLLPRDIPFVIELSPKREATEIVEAADRWRREFGE